MANPAPTLVSTFEILFTPQLPPGIAPTPVKQVDELVVKGYFLTIANPNPTAYTFSLGFHCNVNPAPVPPLRTLASAVGFLDDGTTGSSLSIVASATGVDFSAKVTVAANGTVLVGILPAFFNMTGLVSPNIECRGWVDISLPALPHQLGSGPFGPVELLAQSSGPVGVLLTPEQRLTFLPMSGDVATAVEAQSAFTLPPAAGAGLVQIPPQPTQLFKLQANSVAQAVPAEVVPALGHALQTNPAHAGAMLAMLVGASPAVQEGKVTTEDALKSLGFTS